MSSKGWFNLEAAAGTIPETQFFEGDSAFKALGLTRTQRLYGFAGWYAFFFIINIGLGYHLLTSNRACLCSYALGLILSFLGTVMFIVGGLGPFSSAPRSFFKKSLPNL